MPLKNILKEMNPILLGAKNSKLLIQQKIAGFKVTYPLRSFSTKRCASCSDVDFGDIYNRRRPVFAADTHNDTDKQNEETKERELHFSRKISCNVGIHTIYSIPYIMSSNRA